ncbi:MAG TPA: hypothetical protein VEZ42_10525, partial [Pseudonocardia sp.]|nr:hypothetical protein [Pseudonocardia sp.]
MVEATRRAGVRAVLLSARRRVAPAPQPRHGRTAGGLTDAIRSAVHDPGTAARADQLVRLVREEGGLPAAVGVLESVVGGTASGRLS